MRGARTGVDVDALPAGDGVHAHDGVHALDGLAAHGVARRAGAVRLRDRGVHRGEALEVLLEAGAEGRVERVAAVCGRGEGGGRPRKARKGAECAVSVRGVGLNGRVRDLPGAPERVAAVGRARDHLERGRARWLALVRDV